MHKLMNMNRKIGYFWVVSILFELIGYRFVEIRFFKKSLLKVFMNLFG